MNILCQDHQIFSLKHLKNNGKKYKRIYVILSILMINLK
jgi:hypothetical protein